jgi:hypothetical protein
VQPFLIIDTLQEFTNAGVGVVKIEVFVAVNLLLFQRFYGSAQELVGRAGITELGLNSQFADG